MAKQTVKEWVKENLKDYIDDIYEHGCVNGFPGITYYDETVAFHDQFEDIIWDMLWEDKMELGEKHILALISHFGGAKDVGSMEQFKNLLCWYAVERVCREIVDNGEADFDDEDSDVESCGDER
jgi:hypothetical protein